MAHEYTGTSDFHTGLVELTLPMLTAPPPPDLVNAVLMELWKMNLKEYQKKLEDQQHNMAKVYALILGHVHQPSAIALRHWLSGE